MSLTYLCIRSVDFRDVICIVIYGRVVMTNLMRVIEKAVSLYSACGGRQGCLISTV